MSRNEIIEKVGDVYTMVTGKDWASENITENSRLGEDMGLNSVGILYLVIGIEESFDIRFENVGFGDFNTVADVINYIEEKVSV